MRGKSRTKKVVILKHGGGELANQLWNYASIFAFGLEIGAPVRNPSFFEYHSSFRSLPNEGAVTRAMARLFPKPRRRSHVINRLARKAYLSFESVFESSRRACILSSENSKNKVFYLPPTSPLPSGLSCETLYFKGWLFRNPQGLNKHARALRDAFRPVESIEKKVDDILRRLRASHQHVIGVHIRQGDYATFKGGKFLIDQKRVREIIDEYLARTKVDPRETSFLVASDGALDASVFDGLNAYISDNDAVTDLFLLSRTDTIIGSDSSFGDFAAWYGDIPHIVMQNAPIDWEYYQNRYGFFENKYSTLTQY